MRTKPDTTTMLKAVLPAAISPCLIPVPVRACADAGAGFAILSLPVALAVFPGAPFGLRRRRFAERLRLLSGGFFVTLFRCKEA